MTEILKNVDLLGALQSFIQDTYPKDSEFADLLGAQTLHCNCFVNFFFFFFDMPQSFGSQSMLWSS